jgi:Excalibur calcium-binding domain
VSSRTLYPGIVLGRWTQEQTMTAVVSTWRRIRLITATAALVGVGFTGIAAGAPSGATGRWKNCTAYNTTYPHGVGKARAHDHTSGTPVTDFKHSTHLYNVAMSHNSGLDRDKDHIACEKA